MYNRISVSRLNATENFADRSDEHALQLRWNNQYLCSHLHDMLVVESDSPLAPLLDTAAGQFISHHELCYTVLVILYKFCFSYAVLNLAQLCLLMGGSLYSAVVSNRFIIQSRSYQLSRKDATGWLPFILSVL